MSPLVVSAQEWVAAVARLREQGFGWFDSLHVVDELGRPDEDGCENLRVICRLVAWHDDGEPEQVLISCLVRRDDPRLETLSSVCGGATWYEREAHDLFGITFIDGDDRPLIFHQDPGVEPLRPLRKDAVLSARAVHPWPGSKESGQSASGSRRRLSPVGVPDAEVWGARTPGDPASDHEVAQALSGGRMRRRR